MMSVDMDITRSAIKRSAMSKISLNSELLIAQKNNHIDELLASNEVKRKIINEMKEWLTFLVKEIDLKDAYHNKHIKIGAEQLLRAIERNCNGR